MSKLTYKEATVRLNFFLLGSIFNKHNEYTENGNKYESTRKKWTKENKYSATDWDLDFKMKLRMVSTPFQSPCIVNAENERHTYKNRTYSWHSFRSCPYFFSLSFLLVNVSFLYFVLDFLRLLDIKSISFISYVQLLWTSHNCAMYISQHKNSHVYISVAYICRIERFLYSCMCVCVRVALLWFLLLLLLMFVFSSLYYLFARIFSIATNTHTYTSTSVRLNMISLIHTRNSIWMLFVWARHYIHRVACCSVSRIQREHTHSETSQQINEKESAHANDKKKQQHFVVI